MRLDAPGRRRRLIDLAPLVDIVFLLLVFFMLATQFDRERALPLDVAGPGAAEASEQPALDVRLGPDGRLRLDDRPADLDALSRRLAALPGRPVNVRPEAEVTLAQIHAVLERIAESEAASATLVRDF
ncbi:MAG: ExbD/TolR family protein [Myxococcota bacterium]